MSFRFWRRIRLAPGVTLNLSKSTASLSFGPRGAKYTISPRGNRVTAGLPGTGLFYTMQTGRGAGRAPSVRARDRLDLGFSRRLVTPVEERALVDGLRALQQGDEEAALSALMRGAALPDAAWMAGMIHLRRNALDEARHHLTLALQAKDRLGTHFAKYGIAAHAHFTVTPEIDAHALPRECGTRLALAEIAQIQGDEALALSHLEQVLRLAPDDPVALLSLVELTHEGDQDQLRRIAALTAGTMNETPVDAAILLYRARALAGLGLAQGAIDALTLGLRRRKDRPAALLHRLRHDRALLYRQTGRKAQAIREFERLAAEQPEDPQIRATLASEGIALL